MEDIEMMRIEEFIGLVKHFEGHCKRADGSGCHSCTWVRAKLRTLQDKMVSYLNYRSTDDDLIDWNVLLLELLNMDEKPTSQTIHTNQAWSRIKEEEEDGGQFREIETELAGFAESEGDRCDLDKEEKDGKKNREEDEDEQLEQENRKEGEPNFEAKAE